MDHEAISKQESSDILEAACNLKAKAALMKEMNRELELILIPISKMRAKNFVPPELKPEEIQVCQKDEKSYL
jgi:hypothetical protein